MRLDRLDLVRYGKFTDRSLDFGRPEPGKPDFHDAACFIAGLPAPGIA